MSEDTIRLAGLEESFGVDITGDSRKLRVEGDGQRKEYDISPWQVNDDDDLPF